MSDNLLHEVVVESSKVVAKEAYADILQPTLKPTGEILSLIPRAINASLEPLHAWIAQKEYNIEETKKLLALKLTHITPDNIVSPESYIAIPALQQISYSMNNESLRDLYANLLAKAMNKETKNAVHPAFVDIIKQLSPDEALLNKYIYEAYTRSDNCFAIPLLIVSEVYPDKTSKVIIHGFSDFLDKAGCREKVNAKFYFDNLVRLQILTNTTGSLFPNPNV